MFFTECARLAERHPELSTTIEAVDSCLRDMGGAETIRPSDLASFLACDPHKIETTLELLTQAELLRTVAMIECPSCGMAAPRREYEEIMDEEEEYDCTGCGRDLPPKSVISISTYRRDGTWQASVPEPTRPADDRSIDSINPSSGAPILDEEGWYAPERLAEVHRVDKECLRGRLKRYRKNNMDGWQEREDRRPRESKYLYQPKFVKHIIQDLASSERPAK